MIDNKTSLLIPQQLPQFVRDEQSYNNFVLFLKAYYEWMESSNTADSQVSTANSTGQGVTYASKNLLNYMDVDNTIDDFVSYFTNDFLPFFPEDALVNKQQAVKIARELYQSKGTPSSYQFLFRVLYNSEFDLFYTKDAVLKPSDGVWYVAKSLKLLTTDTRFLSIKNLRLFGETSQAIATVENVILAGTKTEVFISNIERLFQSGETIRVVDTHNQDVIIDGQPLSATLVGQVSQVNISPSDRGLLYQPGDPVIVYDGTASPTSLGATAQVDKTTAGSIQAITVTNEGYGYTYDPQTTINIDSDGFGSVAQVYTLDPDQRKAANVSFVPSQSLGQAWNTHINANTYAFLQAHPTSNANTAMANGFSFLSYTTNPLSSVLVTNGGGGIKKIPTVTATSLYATDFQDQPTADLSAIGILAPIQILNAGNGYVANDTIVLTGGRGYGAHAKVTTVDGLGGITNVAYTYSGTDVYPLGGMGYTRDNLPLATVQSANNQASGATLFVPGILGAGAQFSVTVDRAGSILSIKLIDGGEDYVSTPNVSLKVQDIVVSNVSIANLPRKGDTIFQGTNLNVASYVATVNSVSLLVPYNDPSLSLYNLRVFEYTSNPNPTLDLKIDRDINMIMSNTAFDSSYNQYGYKNYGDGSAKATAKFLDGLVIGQGQYIDQRGQPSSFSVLQSKNYNNYTYQITVSKEIAKYREILLNLLHPAGMNIIGRMQDLVNLEFNQTIQDALYSGRSLYVSNGGIGTSGATVTMSTDFNNFATNVVQFNDLAGANIADIIFPETTTLQIEPTNGPNIHSEVISVDYNANTVTLATNTWLTFANVASISGANGSNAININTLTGLYDIINGGNYSNTAYPLMDIVYPGDKILVANNTVKTVKSVDYTTGNGVIYLTRKLTADANSLLSVNRTFTANSSLASDQIRLYGPVGTTYIPELTTESGFTLITENGSIILLG